MNIHSASLFPGLDGFGRSLKLDLEIKVADEGKVISEQTIEEYIIERNKAAKDE